jgi:hypothetical protein
MLSSSSSEPSEPRRSSNPPNSSPESPSSSSVISRGFRTGGADFSFVAGEPSRLGALRTTPAADCTSSIAVFSASFAGFELASLERMLRVAASRCTGASFVSSGTSRGDVETALILSRHL